MEGDSRPYLAGKIHDSGEHSRVSHLDDPSSSMSHFEAKFEKMIAQTRAARDDLDYFM